MNYSQEYDFCRTLNVDRSVAYLFEKSHIFPIGLFKTNYYFLKVTVEIKDLFLSIKNLKPLFFLTPKSEFGRSLYIQSFPISPTAITFNCLTESDLSSIA